MTTIAAPRLKTSPWPHQSAAFDFVERKHGALLDMGMGTGKSRVVVQAVAERGHERTLIVCPNSVMADHVWPKEFSRHYDGPILVAELTEAGVAKRAASARSLIDRAALIETPLVLVVNYESAWREPLASVLMHGEFDLVVLDESHRAKAPGGKASLFLSRLGARVSWRLALSGTPLANGLLDAYAQYRFLDRSVFGTNYAAFKARYAVSNPNLPQMVIGYQNQDEFSERFYRIAFHVGSEVLTLPEPTHLERTFQLGPEARRIYQSIERDFVAELAQGEITATNVLTRLLRLQQIAGGHVRTDDGEAVAIDGAKEALLEDILGDLERDEPIVIFARFRADLVAIERITQGTGRRYAELSGVLNDLKAWKAGEADVLGVQIQSGGVGIDLTRARYCLYYSLDFSLANYLQSLARVHRPGQTRPVTYIHLIAAGTVEEHIYEALDKKEDVVETVRNWGRIYAGR